MLSKDNFIDLLDKIKSPFHFVEIARELLLQKGFTELKENESWTEIPTKFFVVRQERSLLAGIISSKTSGVFIGGHIDFPAYTIHENSDNRKMELNTCTVTNYGAPLPHTWFDHDLGIAGLVVYKNNEGKIEQKLIKTGAVAIIPNISSYLEKSRNAKLPPLVPIFGGNTTLSDIITREVGCKKEDIISHNLRFFCVDKPSFSTFDGDFITGQGLDDLCCSIPLLDAFLNHAEQREKSIFAYFADNEEIGSLTPHGAGSDLIPNIIHRLGFADSFFVNSYFVSCDVVHGHHYQYPDKTLSGSECILGEGVGHMWSPQSTTASNSELFTQVDSIARKNSITINKYFNTTAGTTISRVITTRLGVKSIDLGVPLLAMHSIREIGAWADIESYYKLVIALFKDL